MPRLLAKLPAELLKQFVSRERNLAPVRQLDVSYRTLNDHASAIANGCQLLGIEDDNLTHSPSPVLAEPGQLLARPVIWRQALDYGQRYGFQHLRSRDGSRTQQHVRDTIPGSLHDLHAALRDHPVAE